MAVTLVAAVATGGAALTNPFFWAFAGEISGAISGGAAAAIGGSDIGSGMLTGTITGGITGGAFGAAGGVASEAASASCYIVQGAGDVVARTLLTDLGSSFVPAIGNIAMQSVISSGVGAGSDVIKQMLSAVEANGQGNKTGWWPTYANFIVPTYGFYCGPSINGQNFTQEPYDLSDRAAMHHDKNYLTGDFNNADKQLISELEQARPKNIYALMTNLLRYDSRMTGQYVQFGSSINYNIYGEIYREGARATFSTIVKIRENQ